MAQYITLWLIAAKQQRESSLLPMEASLNPSRKRLWPKKWETSPDRAGSNHGCNMNLKLKGFNISIDVCSV
ncbi:hypothetical protein D6S13_24860 [Salmonella enterica subsp. enterica]|nr:hypothetical protein [Salmonella enterica subsp. enterica]